MNRYQNVRQYAPRARRRYTFNVADTALWCAACAAAFGFGLCLGAACRYMGG